MFTATPQLFISHVGNQILSGPGGLHTLLHQPDFDPISSRCEVGSVVTHLYCNLGKKGEGMRVALETLAMLTSDSSIPVVRTTLEVMADFLRRLNKGVFKKAVLGPGQTHGTAFLWSPDARSVIRRKLTTPSARRIT